MERLRSRWTAGAGALLLVLSLSGAAGAAALISSVGPTAGSLEKSAGRGQVAEKDRDAGATETPDRGTDTQTEDVEGEDAAQAGAEDAARRPSREGTVATDGCQTPDTGAAVTDPQSSAEPGATANQGSSVSQVARDKSMVGGPHQNHGYCVSRAAHGVGAEPSPEQANAPSECGTGATSTKPGTGGQQDAARNHGAVVSAVARSDAVAQKTDATGQVVEGSTCNHGHAVSAVARGKGAQTDTTAGSERVGKGHGATKVKTHGKDKAQGQKSRRHPRR